ncbi:MAG TPA: zinc ribbon domain-containing protein, partial [Methanocorpusculum sp.]|nr:zinc ribbon domain-containing protein [Methanocorpusculum sp.]
LTKSEEIVEWLKGQIVAVLNDTLGELKAKKQMGVLDMPAYLQEIEQLCLAKLTRETEVYGLKIMKFAGLNINMPEEVQEAINKRGAMSALGVNYIQYQSGKAIEGIGTGAAQGGGEGSGFAMMGAGMGAGVGMGNMMAQGMAGMAAGQPAPFGGQPPASQQPQGPMAAQVRCPKCGTTAPAGTKFCPECGTSMVQPESGRCTNCGAVLQPGAKFCPECGTKVGSPKCPACGSEVAAGAKFCPECGQKL